MGHKYFKPQYVNFMSDKHDVVIPLGVKSFCNENLEIKVAVASIKKYCKFLNRIIIVSQIQPIRELAVDIIWVNQDDIPAEMVIEIVEKTMKRAASNIGFEASLNIKEKTA